MSKPPLDEAKIREAAYRLWQDEGHPEGRDQDHWSKAVAALTPEQADATDKAPAAAADTPPAKKPRKTAAKPAVKAAKPAVKKEAKPKAPAKPRKPKAE